MKSLLFSLLLAVSLTGFSQAVETSNSGLKWYTDIRQADSLSKATGRPIFAFFTGSDWCGWCMKLQRDVFAKAEFVSWAKNKVVLLELDFPRKKQLPAELQQQNASLQQALQVNGYPTVWLIGLSPAGENGQTQIMTYGSLGYPSGAEQGKEEVKFLANANAILNNGK